MADKNEHIYSAEDIQRYLQGKMSPEEMHLLERRALDDPFLADAIEGYMAAQRERQDVAPALHSIRESLKNRNVAETRVVPLRRMEWWKIAAAACLVLIAGVFLYKTVSLPEEQGLAKTVITPDQVPATPAPSTSVESESSLAATDTSTTNSQVETKNTPSPALAKQNLQRDTVRNFQSAQDALTRAESGKASEQVSPLDHESAPPRRGIEPVQEAAISKPSDYKIAGRVVDELNRPIPQATVQLSERKKGVQTNEQGEFSLSAADSTETVSVSSIGYTSKTEKVSANANNNIMLEPSRASTNEVVVTGAGAANKKSSRQKVPSPGAVPVDGWVEYEKYLKANNRMNNVVDGSVTISFQVDKRGRLSDFKVVRSLDESADKEAIRLVREGPKWKLLRGNRAPITMNIEF